jgi:hypothetical protein
VSSSTTGKRVLSYVGQSADREGVSMSYEKRKILDIVKGVLTPKQLKGSLIYWNARALKAGETVISSPLPLTMPFGGAVAFVDLAPRFNWAHPCLYVFISESLQTRVVDSSFPPAMDRPGDRWIVLLRFGKNPKDEHNLDAFP